MSPSHIIDNFSKLNPFCVLKTSYEFVSFNYPNFQNAYALLSSSNLNWQNKVKLFTRI